MDSHSGLFIKCQFLLFLFSFGFLFFLGREHHTYSVDDDEYDKVADNKLLVRIDCSDHHKDTADNSDDRCDETLEASNENLLSRVSKLEDAVALGVSIKPSPKQITEEKKEEKTQPKTEQPEPKSVKSEPAPKLKGLSCWAEVIDRVSQSDNRVASYLRQTRAFVADGEVVKVFVPDSFTMMMIDGSGAKDLVRAALSMCLKREVKDSQLVFEAKPKDLPDDVDALDEIIQNIEN